MSDLKVCSARFRARVPAAPRAATQFRRLDSGSSNEVRRAPIGYTRGAVRAHAAGVGAEWRSARWTESDGEGRALPVPRRYLGRSTCLQHRNSLCLRSRPWIPLFAIDTLVRHSNSLDRWRELLKQEDETGRMPLPAVDTLIWDTDRSPSISLVAPNIAPDGIHVFVDLERLPVGEHLALEAILDVLSERVSSFARQTVTEPGGDESGLCFSISGRPSFLVGRASRSLDPAWSIGLGAS